MINVDNAIKLAQKNFNKRQYEQFILPIIQSIEDKFNKEEKIKNKLIWNNIYTSLMATINTKAESINDENYISIKELDSLLQQEINLYIN